MNFQRAEFWGDGARSLLAQSGCPLRHDPSPLQFVRKDPSVTSRMPARSVRELPRKSARVPDAQGKE